MWSHSCSASLVYVSSCPTAPEIFLSGSTISSPQKASDYVSSAQSNPLMENTVSTVELKNNIPYCFLMYHHLPFLQHKNPLFLLQHPFDPKHPLFVKVVDSVRGSPASNVPVKLYKESAEGSWELLSSK